MIIRDNKGRFVKGIIPKGFHDRLHWYYRKKSNLGGD